MHLLLFIVPEVLCEVCWTIAGNAEHSFQLICAQSTLPHSPCLPFSLLCTHQVIIKVRVTQTLRIKQKQLKFYGVIFTYYLLQMIIYLHCCQYCSVNLDHSLVDLSCGAYIWELSLAKLHQCRIDLIKPNL